MNTVTNFNISDLMLMRQELLLIALFSIILIIEVFRRSKDASYMLPFTFVAFGLITIAGFFEAPTGNLFGGMFQVDALRITMKNILNVGTFIVLLQSYTWLKKEENVFRISEYFILLIITLTGMNFMISSGDFLMFYIGLEIATIPLAILAAYDRTSKISAEAGIKLILMSALSSGVMLYGISMIYGTTGSVYFDVVSTKIAMDSLQLLAFIFFFSGMAFKISLVPYHLWAADVYEGAPTSISSYLSVISKGAAVFIFTIVLFTVFKTLAPMWELVLYTIIIITITIGNLFALRQTNLKRFLAFSSIAQAGFLLLGVISGTAEGMASVVYFAMIYIFSNLAAFGIVAAIENKTGKLKVEDYNGLYQSNPKLSLLMLVSMFSLAGIPPVAGYFGKFFLYMSAVRGGSLSMYILVLIAIVNTIISLYYYLQIVKAMFLTTSENPIPYFKNDFPTRLSLILCFAGIFVIGFLAMIYNFILSNSFGI
ncbi:MAG: NADH-quinone oxidoreductase subunit N [Bacteroidota bacterium]